MRAALLALVLVGAAGCARPTPLAEVHPLCGQQDVLGFVGDTLRRRAVYLEVLPLTVAERSVPGRPDTQCSVYARQVGFDTPLRGPAPAVAMVPVSYRVQPVTNGYVVEVAPLR